VYLDDGVFEGMCSSWKDALVVTLLGKTLGYQTMKDQLKKSWKLTGGFEIRDVDNGFYVVKFDMVADKEKVITQGPWMIYDHYLAVSHWSPEFISPAAKVNRTLVWIRFPGLNLVFYDESFLLAMASAVGKPIKVDTNTLNVERGRFARVCVEIDLNEPVVGKVWLKGFWYKVEYEGLHIICSSCGRYGHHTRNCTYKSIPPPVEARVNGERPSGPGNITINVDAGMVPKINAPGDNIINNNIEHSKQNDCTIKDINVQTETHGEWMVVTRKKKKQQVVPPLKKVIANGNLNHMVKNQFKGKEIVTGPNIGG
jgi:hypothetical protein